MAVFQAHEKLMHAYRTSTGIGWGEYNCLLGEGARRFFQPLYENFLVPNVPSEVRAKLQHGAAVADIGCGEGISCNVLAAAFPSSKVVGFDNHAPSIANARKATKAKGLANATYEVASADACGRAGAFDVVLFFDCFHDMPVASAAARNAHKVLKPDGLVFLIELNAPEEDSVEAQLALPTCAFFTAFGCMCCLPCGMCDDGDGLGNTVPTSTLRKIFVEGAGFASLEAVPNEKFNSLGFRILLAKK